MNDATDENDFPWDYHRARAVLKAERRVTVSLLQRRLGIGYRSALQLTAELRPEQPSSAFRSDVALVLNSRTLYRLYEIWHGPRGSSDIGIAEDDLDALLTGDGVSSKITIRSAVGESGGPDRARLAVYNAVGATEEIAYAFRGTKRLIVLVGAAPATLMGRELNLILSELRQRLNESCSISLGIQHGAPSADDTLCVTVIYSQ